MYKINKLQGYVAHHRDYSQYFIITINGGESIKILNHCFTLKVIHNNVVS